MKTMKKVGLAVVMAASVVAMNSARAEELILVVDSCADAACAVQSIDDEINAETEWSLDEQLQKLEAQFAQPLFAKAEAKQHRDGRALYTDSAYSVRVN